jgi:hypothetical protein
MDEISIDRLIFDIPGLNAAQARDLAQRVGEGLAQASSNTQTNFDALAVDLNYPAAAQGIPRLADSIVRALLMQMGGR